MSSIKEKILKVEEIVKSNIKKELKYNFEFNYTEEFVNNECLLKKIDRDYIVESKSLKLVLMLFRYPKDDVIPFDEYSCVYVLVYEDKLISNNIIYSDVYDDVLDRYNALEKIINEKNVDDVIDTLLKES